MQGERRVRGGGIYPTASLLNHECLPNVVRQASHIRCAIGVHVLEIDTGMGIVNGVMHALR